VPTEGTRWLVFKGMALNDDFPGKDFDAVPVDSPDADLEASIASTLSREHDDLELNVDTARRRAGTLGCEELPPRQVMGLRVYVVMATSIESLCLSANYAMRPRQILAASWPAHAGTPDKLLAAGMPGLLREQLRVLLEEGVHLGNYE